MLPCSNGKLEGKHSRQEDNASQTQVISKKGCDSWCSHCLTTTSTYDHTDHEKCFHQSLFQLHNQTKTELLRYIYNSNRRGKAIQSSNLSKTLFQITCAWLALISCILECLPSSLALLRGNQACDLQLDKVFCTFAISKRRLKVLAEVFH